MKPSISIFAQFVVSYYSKPLKVLETEDCLCVV